MSRIGNKAVEIPAGVAVQVDGQRVTVKGSQGELSLILPAPILAKVKDGRVEVTRTDDEKQSKGLHGLNRSLIANMVEGVSKGFSKELELQGVGFRAAVQGTKITLSLGYSSPIEYTAPSGIRLAVKESTIVVSGPDKKRVGDVAARIRRFYPPEPYKGKGVRYKGEYVRRKVGKTVA
jgi:large subunit ribosomal protein L6